MNKKRADFKDEETREKAIKKLKENLDAGNLEAIKFVLNRTDKEYQEARKFHIDLNIHKHIIKFFFGK